MRKTGCQVSFSTMKRVVRALPPENTIIVLKEYNVTFPTLDEYHIWLSQFSNGNFSEPYAAQLQADALMSVANGSCISHIQYQLNSDESVDVYAQINHCGHEILQKKRSHVLIAFENLNNLIEQSKCSTSVSLIFKMDACCVKKFTGPMRIKGDEAYLGS
uniref:Uncharacterized protein n=1 Tax=Ditylenchus dipsaci TaxID=166011 RepID=A0A915D9F0_9BILA